MFEKSNLNPLHSARMSGYALCRSSKALGTTLTSQLPSGAFCPALKHSEKYPGCFGSMQKAYTERFGLASVYVVNQRSMVS